MPEYNREKAIKYAHKWAYGRNPAYYDFQNIGGDCTNFISQCIYAGASVMNYTPVTGWYYITSYNRTASWTGVEYLYNFLTSNKHAGPYAVQTNRENIEPGDVIQLSADGERFSHSLFVVDISGEVIMVATHTFDSDYRPLSTYFWKKIRYLHIAGVRN